MSGGPFTLGELAGRVTGGNLAAMAKMLNDAGADPPLDELEPDPALGVAREAVILLVAQRPGTGEGQAAARLLDETMGEPSPTPLDYALPAGIGLGHVRLVPPRDAADLVCQLCGQHVGAEVWSRAVSDGLGGLYWTAPICDRCRTGAARIVVEPEAERTRRLAAMAINLAELAAELTARRQAKSAPVTEPEPEPRLKLRRRRPAAPAAKPAEPAGPPPTGDGTEDGWTEV